MTFDGKVALVTGAASGIGRATATQLAELGVRVFAIDRDEARLKEAFEGQENIRTHSVDVSDSAAINTAVAALDALWGRLDILVNAAGINAPNAASNQALIDANMKTINAIKSGQRPMFSFIEETSDEDFAKVMEVNLYSQFYCLRAAVPVMKRTGGGTVVNIASVAALIGVTIPLYYPASKAGVLGLTRAAAAELAPYNIRVNAICPGGVDTPLMHQQPKEMVEFLVGMQPIQRLASPQELAQTIVFLADDSKAGYYTGQTLSPCGGVYM